MHTAVNFYSLAHGKPHDVIFTGVVYTSLKFADVFDGKFIFADPYAPERKITGDTAKNIWSIWYVNILFCMQIKKGFLLWFRHIIDSGMQLKMEKKTVFGFC